MKLIRNTGLLALVAAAHLLLPFSVAAQKKEQALPLDPAVRTGKLPNGFTYYIRRNTEPRNRVVIYLVNKVGSVLETDDQQGLAHFMEHMNFNGTRHFPKNELVDYLQKTGVRFGADLNAYTGFDETVYQLPLPADDPDIVKHGLLIMRDWAQEATLDAGEINKERGVVLEEKRLGMGAQERMQRKIFPMMLNNSRYAERLPIGKEDVLSNFEPEVIRRYHKDWYRPDLQALIIVGDIDPPAMEKLVKKQFADLKNPVHERPRTKYSVPLTGKNQFLAVTDKEMPSTVIQINIKHKGLPLITAGDYRKSLVRELFNVMLSQRYSELSQMGNPPFIECGAGIDGLLGGLDAYTLSIVAKPGEIERGFKTAWRETQRVSSFGFTASELERARDAVLRHVESAAKEQGKTPSESYVKEYVQYFLNKTASPGVAAELALVKRQLPGISLAEVNSLSKEYIRPENRDIIVQAPEKDRNGLPDEAQFNEWIRAVAAESLLPYSDRVAAGSLLPVVPVPGKIVTEQPDRESGITAMTLSNGVKVLLKPTDFKNNEVLFNAYAPGGTSLYGDHAFESAANAPGIIGSFGAGNYDAVQLQKFLENKQVAFQDYFTDRLQGFSGGAIPADLETAMQLLYARMVYPRRDTGLFNSIISRSRAAILNRGDDPASVFQDSLAATMGNHSPRLTGPTIEKLEQIDLDKCLAIYRERFGDAAGYTFVFVGSFTMEQMRPLIEKYIASLPAAGKPVSPVDLGLHIPAGRIEKNVFKGSENKATVRLVFSGPFDYSPENVMRLDALKEVLEFRLLERLREDESGVYTPQVQAQPVKFPSGRFSYTIAFGCAVQNVDKLVASALDEIEQLKKQGPPQVNIDKYKAEQRRVFETNVRTNAYWLSYISFRLQNGEDMSLYKSFNNRLEGVTRESIRQLANDCLNGNNYIKAVLLPETSAKGK
jgi:zinc protease